MAKGEGKRGERGGTATLSQRRERKGTKGMSEEGLKGKVERRAGRGCDGVAANGT